jgi:hypothetical protein
MQKVETTFIKTTHAQTNVYKNNTCTDNALKGMVRRAVPTFASQELATVLVTFSSGVKHV